MIRRRNQFMDWKITIENRFLSFLSTPSFRYKPKPYILCLSPKLNLGLFLYTSLKHDATPLKAKIESSLYQDFHVLYVHIERDKKQEGNESEKLSQFCSRRRAPYYLCSRASARFHTVPLPPTLASLGSTRQFQWNIDEMQKESPSPKCKRPFQYFLAPFSIG